MVNNNPNGNKPMSDDASSSTRERQSRWKLQQDVELQYNLYVGRNLTGMTVGENYLIDEDEPTFRAISCATSAIIKLTVDNELLLCCCLLSLLTETT